MAKGLAVIGDYYHPATGIRELFESVYPGAFWDFRTDPTKAPWSTLEAYDLLVLSSENRIGLPASDAVWMDEETGRRIVSFVEKGGALVAFHSGIASYPDRGAYARLAGGTFQFHPKDVSDFDFVPAEVDHPILRGIPRFSVRDEQYFVSREADSTTLLGRVESPRYGSSSALWCAERGAGRIVGFTIGHRKETLDHPAIRAIAANAVRWGLRGGA